MTINSNENYVYKHSTGQKKNMFLGSGEWAKTFIHFIWNIFYSGSKKLKIELKKKSGTKKKAEMFEDADSGLDEGPDSGENFVVCLM